MSDLPEAGCEADVVEISNDLRVTATPRRVASMPDIFGLTWVRDGRSLVFGGNSDRTGLDRLWRVASDGRSPPEPIDEAGLRVGNPATARNADGLVFPRFETDIDVFTASRTTAAHVLISSSGDDAFPAYSNDGREIAFASDRSGQMELWTAATDGTGQRQLTQGPNHAQRAPRWGTGDRRIAFESQSADGHWHLWTIGLDGGPPHQITFSAGDQIAPTWSRDGEWLYFNANRGNGWSTWRIAATGGTEQHIADAGGGHVVFESPDGRELLIQERSDESALLLEPAVGGQARTVVTCASADVYTWTSSGIYYVPCHAGDNAPVHLLDPVTGKDRVVAVLEGLDMPSQTDLAVSPDGSTFLYTRRVNEERGGDLWLIENFK
jgi:Tol biopolymer transport system component